ncbi:MAG: RNA degradosome polyphosphate kinase, partial [Alphaproteobacteria bacterium]|nr:RNA degradosome polyphosphate kinase [Alphaproteobacteria bacterium]
MAEADPATSLTQPMGRYFNRELSWLAFNQRVLEEAMNRAHPLLERLRFLSISGANLDEFFSVRVAGLKGQQLQDVDMCSADGLTAGQQLTAIAVETDRLMQAQQKVWGVVHGELAQVGIEVVGPTSPIDPLSEAWLRDHFLNQIFPILTPQALDPAHPFPFIPNQGLSIVFDLQRLSDKQPIRELVMIPASLARFVRIPGEPARYMALEAVVRRFSVDLFPGYMVRNSGVFRIIRDSDIEIEEEAEDLVRHYRSAIKRRRRGRVIRMEIEERIPEPVEEMLQDMLQGHEAVVVEVEGFIGIGDLSGVVEEDRPDLKFEPYAPRFPERIREYGGDCFAAIRAKDIVVHHPYEAFDVVVAFLKQAAVDPDVVAIKQTL